MSHCTALFFCLRTQHCSFISLHSTILLSQYTALFFYLTAQPYSLSHYKALVFVSPHSTILCLTTQYYSFSLHGTILCLTTQHYSLSHYTALFFVSLHSTILCLTTQHYPLPHWWIYPSSMRKFYHLYPMSNFGQDTERYLICESLGTPSRQSYLAWPFILSFWAYIVQILRSKINGESLFAASTTTLRCSCLE